VLRGCYAQWRPLGGLPWVPHTSLVQAYWHRDEPSDRLKGQLQLGAWESYTLYMHSQHTDTVHGIQRVLA
jgi:hypothetical protein